MPMSPVRHPAPITLMLLLAAGCSSSDDRLVRHVTESNRQQAEQNREMARLHQNLAEGNTRLVEAVAESRQEMLAMESNLQDQRDRLEAERKSLASQRYWESLLAPALTDVGMLLVASLPLVLCWYLLHGLRSAGDDDVNEVLLRELVAEDRLLLPAPRSQRRRR